MKALFTESERAAIIAADKAHVWHPFTPMRAWIAADHEPIVIARGEGAYLIDAGGNRYLDGNSSIWTNIHGHGHPRLLEALERQAHTLAHASSLGFANAPAALLAERLCAFFPGDTLTKVFFTDDGSTAVECALRMAIQYWQLGGQPEKRRFVVFDQAYHGDTTGAASLGGIGAFHDRFAGFGYPVTRIAAADALAGLDPASIAGLVIEPLIQGAAGMRVWPEGMLRELRRWCDASGVLLILDEVMTGFGRTGAMFACQREGVVPDMMALAKGITGGLLPLAATLTTNAIYEPFLEEGNTFYYGHSYTGNPLGCAVSLASLALFDEEGTLERVATSTRILADLLAAWQSADSRVGEVRQCGLIAGIDVVAKHDPEYRVGAAICVAARKHGLLTRPVRNTLVLMPPLCVTASDLALAVRALRLAAEEVLRG